MNRSAGHLGEQQYQSRSRADDDEGEENGGGWWTMVDELWRTNGGGCRARIEEIAEDEWLRMNRGDCGGQIAMSKAGRSKDVRIA